MSLKKHLRTAIAGLVLAAVRTGLEMTLVEAREKKWAFLSAAARKAAKKKRQRLRLVRPAGASSCGLRSPISAGGCSMAFC